MTVTACKQWVSAARTKDRCIGCIGPDCKCPGCQKGWHYDPSTLHYARKEVNAGFVEGRKNNNGMFK